MGIFNKYTLSAAAAALAFSTAPATAADFGGDCCADLEERVAVLEATTARKGNRKVSLVISGQVNQSLMIWDDGLDTDAYVASNSTSASRFRFKGNAKINHDWSAGYYIEIGLATARTLGVTQANDDGGAVFRIRQSNLYIRSNTLGTVTLGQASPGTDDLAFYGSVAGLAGAFQPDWHSGFSMGLVNGGVVTTTQIRDLAGSINGALYFDGTTRQNIVRYDTPTFGGFVVSAAWGEDDFWDVAIRYAGDFGDFKVKAGIGYSEFGGQDTTAAIGDEESLTATAGIIHTPTGIFVHGAYRGYEYDGTQGLPDADGWHIQAGIKQRWNSLGHTAIYGAYTECDDCVSQLAGANALTTSEISRVSVGIHQWIDAAALELYAIYDHTEAELNGVDFEDFDTVTIGGRIKF